MTWPDAVCLLAGWSGTVLLLDRVPWFRTLPLHRRLAPYRADEVAVAAADRGAARQLVDHAADRLASALGLRGTLAERLERAGTTASPAAVRSRRFATVVATALLTAAAVVAARPGWPAAVTALVAAVVGPLLVDDLWLAARARQRAAQVRGELPVVAEQLGMLLSAGYSLPAALQRLARRGNGAVADGLAQVVRRLRQGEPEPAALGSWARSTGVDGAERLVKVLTIHRQAGDLGQLISDEARSVRAEHHRALLESIARRGQLVWIPVTVATLVPGLVVLAVPFASAMSQITGQG